MGEKGQYNCWKMKGVHGSELLKLDSWASVCAIDGHSDLISAPLQRDVSECKSG